MYMSRIIVTFLISALCLICASCRDASEKMSVPIPLIVAAYEGDLLAVQTLIQQGENPNRCASNGVTALMAASAGGKEDVVVTLLTHGASTDAVTADGHTALMMAAYGGHLKTVQTLLSHGATVDMRTREGETALLKACQVSGLMGLGEALGRPHLLLPYSNSQKEEIIEALLRNKGDLNAKGVKRQSALMYLIEGAALVRRDEEPNYKGPFRSQYCITPIDYHVMQLLVRRGCDVNAVDSTGRTACDLAYDRCGIIPDSGNAQQERDNVYMMSVVHLLEQAGGCRGRKNW